ncbi:MAG: hypothetical protein A2Y54_04400 [Chloroflexi bacterium RBG_16_51_16]|nr:MAG: hypothetical protein A2Y54_04400 [Chloroflexi bacterium RBG_16_51_16]
MSRDLRRFARQTNLQIALGAVLILLIVGIGLVWYFYGGAAAGAGLLCVIAGLSPVVLILLVLLALDWILKGAGRE